MGEVKRYAFAISGLSHIMGAELIVYSGDGLPYIRSEDYDALRAENAELVAAMTDLLYASGSHSCSTLHHGKVDRHHYDEPCKPLIRYELSLDKARTALAKHRGEK